MDYLKRKKKSVLWHQENLNVASRRKLVPNRNIPNDLSVKMENRFDDNVIMNKDALQLIDSQIQKIQKMVTNRCNMVSELTLLEKKLKKKNQLIKENLEQLYPLFAEKMSIDSNRPEIKENDPKFFEILSGTSTVMNNRFKAIQALRELDGKQRYPE